MKRCYAKNDNSPFQCHLFSRVMEFMEAPSSADLNLANSLLWRALQQKLYRQDFRDVDRLKCVLLHCLVW